MSTVSFQASPPSSGPHYTLGQTRNRPTSKTHSTSDSDSQNLQTASTTDKHRRRRGHRRHRHHNRSSVHLSIPPIQDRESSLYSRPLYTLPAHDWSKSCSDLTLFPNSASTTRSDSDSHLDQSISISVSPTSTRTPSIVEVNNTLKWCQSTLDLSTITDDWAFELDHYDSGGNSIYSNSSENGSTRRHSFLSSSPSASNPHSFKSPSVTFIEPPRPVAFEHHSGNWPKKLDKLSKRLRIPKSLKMSTSTTTAPNIPPRSALRKTSQTALEVEQSRPALSERSSSLYVLDVGAPLIQTPSLSSNSDSDEADHATSRASPSLFRRSIVEDKEHGVFGKKRIGTDRDPHKIRDGLGARESPSGVYTPPTFPGACGPRPAQYPTHVYTPTNFQLYPAPASAGPSRSCSTSSSEADLPQTPISPTLRMFSNKTMAGIRRISGSIASFDPRSSPTSSSSRDSYFSYAPTSSRQSSCGPISPISANFPYAAGLGVGLAEKDGVTAKVESPMIRRPTEEPKIKRKPVPCASEDEVHLELVDGVKRVSITHAI